MSVQAHGHRLNIRITNSIFVRQMGHSELILDIALAQLAQKRACPRQTSPKEIHHKFATTRLQWYICHWRWSCVRRIRYRCRNAYIMSSSTQYLSFYCLVVYGIVGLYFRRTTNEWWWWWWIPDFNRRPVSVAYISATIFYQHTITDQLTPFARFIRRFVPVGAGQQVQVPGL